MPAWTDSADSPRQSKQFIHRRKYSSASSTKSARFVSYKDIRKLIADLKRVYAAPTEDTALNELELFRDKWDGKYPKIYKSWYDNWANLSTYFKYPAAVRRLIYTTNAIEGFNRQLRKVTKSRTVVSNRRQPFKNAVSGNHGYHKKWTGTARTGDRSIPSWRFILRSVLKTKICKNTGYY